MNHSSAHTIADQAREALYSLASPERAAVLTRFFKTGPGQYGAGDVFIGVSVPDTRSVLRQMNDYPLSSLLPLVSDPVHECRLCGYLALVKAYDKARDEARRREVFEWFQQHREGLNNWDLVDLTAPNIAGRYLLHRDRSFLRTLLCSPSLWEQRTAIVATLTFIRNGDFEDTLKFSHSLLSHPHDLIHKASGWMLREVGKRDPDVLRGFLDRYASVMPRTMLRYALEKFSPGERAQYLNHKRITPLL